MKIIKTFSVFIFVAVVGGLSYLLLPLGHNQQQVILAEELRKATMAMMGDLRYARTATVKGVPADGQWYQEVEFSTDRGKAIGYNLDGSAQGVLRRTKGERTRQVAQYIQGFSVRRQPGKDSVLEVQLKAHKGTSLTSRFKVRMQN